MSEIRADSPAVDAAEAARAHAQIVQMTLAPVIARALYALAECGIPDHFDGHPRSADEIARATGTHARSVYRLLRMSAGLGLFVEGDDRRFTLTPLGAALRSDAPGRARSMVRSLIGPLGWRTNAESLHSVKTGEEAVTRGLGRPLFEFLAATPHEATLFNDTMIAFHGAEPTGVAAAYDFADIGTLIDVGGGTGHLLTTILQAHPHLRGVLYDLPHVAQQARALIADRGLSDRCTVMEGNFFESVPPGGDAYMMSHIIHDWDEARCLTLLEHCRRVLPTPNGRLLILEMVIPPGNDSHPSKVLDMIMLTFTGGQERTEREYASLLERAGLRLTRTVPTASPVSVIESVPAA
jgi:hypothetical protein